MELWSQPIFFGLDIITNKKKEQFIKKYIIKNCNRINFHIIIVSHPFANYTNLSVILKNYMPFFYYCIS